MALMQFSNEFRIVQMAKAELMSWVKTEKRWVKMFKGKRFAVSPRQLGTNSTKEASQEAANNWWREKMAELSVQESNKAPHIFQDTIDTLSKKRLWALRHGEKEIVKELNERIEDAKNIHDKEYLEDPLPYDYPSKRIEAIKALGVEFTEVLDPMILSDFFGDERIWQERFKLDEFKHLDEEKTVGRQVDRWVALQVSRAEAGNLSPDRADNKRICLYHFRDFMSAEASIDSINAKTLNAFYLNCLSKVQTRVQDKNNKEGWTPTYASTVFGMFRSFVRFLWESDLIELPKNIDSRDHRFRVQHKKIQTFTIEEFHKTLELASDRMKAILLLMANCGMQQKDISDLRHEEVDWENGRITRKRSKTKDLVNVPEVTYKLWPLTFKLLKQFKSSDPEIVLLTDDGNRWSNKRLVNGKLVKADNVASCYKWLKLKTKIRKPLKLIRKTSATLLESHEHFGRYKTHFLGHSPRSIADKNYSAPSNDLFDRIIDWLGEQYKLGS